MGRHKAIVEVDGATMLSRVVGALRAAGADPILVIGGDPAWVGPDLAAEWRPDGWPGEGPLGGVITALDEVSAGATTDAVVLIAACDQPWLRPAGLRQLIDALLAAPEAAVAAAVTPDGRRVPFPCAQRAGASAELRRRFEAGARRADASFGLGVVIEVQLSGEEVRDVDSPTDLGSSS